MKLCCSINTFAFCYYCNEKWCMDCWWSLEPAAREWLGSTCPVSNRLAENHIDRPKRGRHAPYKMDRFLELGMDPQYKQEYDAAIVDPKDKWDYEVFSGKT